MTWTNQCRVCEESYVVVRSNDVERLCPKCAETHAVDLDYEYEGEGGNGGSWRDCSTVYRTRCSNCGTEINPERHGADECLSCSQSMADR